MHVTPVARCFPLLSIPHAIIHTRSGPDLENHYDKRISGDWGADRASTSSAALDRERYAVQAIPTDETKGYGSILAPTLGLGVEAY